MGFLQRLADAIFSPFESEKPAKVAETTVDNQRGTPVDQTEEGKLWLQIVNKGCPDCGSSRFREGPSGGLMTNISCENDHYFNVSPMIGIAHRLDKHS